MRVYVELIRNTPFIVQLFFIFFGLPALGVKLTETTAAFLAMVVNLGAYSTEIIRAGIEAVPKGHIEAGVSLAMSRFEVLRYVVLQPGASARSIRRCRRRSSSSCSARRWCRRFRREDLTYAANFIQSRNFRAFEVYLVAAADLSAAGDRRCAHCCVASARSFHGQL